MTILLLVAAALAGDDGNDDDDWGDGDDVGFADAPEVEATPPPPPPLTFSGTAKSDVALWVERLPSQPVAKLRQTLDLRARYSQGDVRAALSVHGELDPVYWLDDRWDAPTFEAYAWQARLDEAWASVARGPVEITAGRQVIGWGEGLLASRLDVVAPRDLREPGASDPDDLRLPVLALRVGVFSGAHRLEAIAVPEAHFGFRSPPSGPFGPVPALLEDNALAHALTADATFRWEHAQPRFAPEQVQGFARWSHKGSGLDVALYGATLLDQIGVMVLPDLAQALSSDEIVITLDHQRYGLLGHSGAAPAGPLLLRWEASVELGRPVNTGDVDALMPDIQTERVTLVGGLVGGTWAGPVTVDLEVAPGWIPARPDDLIYPVDATTWALRVSDALLRDRLRLDAVAVVFGVDARNGGLARAQASYELADGWRASVGAISYRPGRERGPLLGLDRHDRLFVQGRWDF